MAILSQEEIDYLLEPIMDDRYVNIFIKIDTIDTDSPEYVDCRGYEEFRVKEHIGDYKYISHSCTIIMYRPYPYTAEDMITKDPLYMSNHQFHKEYTRLTLEQLEALESERLTKLRGENNAN